MFTFSPLRQEDLPFLLSVRNECRDFLHDDREFTLAESEAWFRETKPTFHVIEHGRERIGYFRLSNHDVRARSIYVGADLHASFRGRGLGRAAYEAFLPLVKQWYDLAAVKLEVLSHNDVALGLYRKLGFVEIERKVGAALRAGRLVDSIVMVKTL